MKKPLTYYSGVPAGTPDAVELWPGNWFVLVTAQTDDLYLREAVTLSQRYGGMAWRRGDGIALDTRYGILEKQ